MTEQLTTLLAGMAGAIDWSIVLNLVVLMIAYYILRELKGWLDKQSRYLHIKRGSLGYRSQVIWEGESFAIDEISRKYGSITLRNQDYIVWVPFPVWQGTPKRISTNGVAKKK